MSYFSFHSTWFLSSHGCAQQQRLLLSALLGAKGMKNALKHLMTNLESFQGSPQPARGIHMAELICL